MKRFMMVALSVVVVLSLGGVAGASLYEVTFTGADIWNMSADNASQARTDQAAPRRYRDWTQQENPLQATTYGLNGGLPTTGFNTWAAGAGKSFAFDELNLWGAGGDAAAAWGENYVSVGTGAPDYGVSSWTLVSAPPGWTDGIVEGGQSYSADATHAFPVWRSGTGLTLSQANMNDPSFVWTFIVDIAPPPTADPPGDLQLRVFFGGYSDDDQMTGPDNYEVSGVKELTATPIPEPATIAIWSLLGGLGIAVGCCRRKRAA